MVHPERFVVRNTFIADNDCAAFFRQASVVVLPYVEATQSGVIPMAYAAARPVVATTVGGLPEMVDEGETGYLVPPRDEVALAKSIVRVLGDDKLRARLGQNARQKIVSECSAEVVADRTLEVYRKALDHRPAAASLAGQHRPLE
jgi:glycosyltransferase involved in cell wall biosynthesis